MAIEADTFEDGYTLLELVVVLVLMGLLMGVATPKVVQLYDSVNFSLEKDEIFFQLAGASFSVYKRGQKATLHELVQSGDITLPEGWTLDRSYSDDVIYTSLGYCDGGNARFTKNGRELLLLLIPPTCTPTIQ